MKITRSQIWKITCRLLSINKWNMKIVYNYENIIYMWCILIILVVLLLYGKCTENYEDRIFSEEFINIICINDH